uniref:Uncharacterized protein n=1 Tax=Panagrolaimus sp. ES5 TaxID=591445 RepID=A0AC34GGK8_9BILA
MHFLYRVFGSFNEYQLLQADKDYDACPFLSPENYDDFEGQLKKISKTITKNRERQQHEVYRIRLEEEESESFEAQKNEYSDWNDRRKYHQEYYSTPFNEPSPNVSHKVKEFFAQKDIEHLF